jgi:hypothetical protein
LEERVSRSAFKSVLFGGLAATGATILDLQGCAVSKEIAVARKRTADILEQEVTNADLQALVNAPFFCSNSGADGDALDRVGTDDSEAIILSKQKSRICRVAALGVLTLENARRYAGNGDKTLTQWRHILLFAEQTILETYWKRLDTDKKIHAAKSVERFKVIEDMAAKVLGLIFMKDFVLRGDERLTPEPAAQFERLMLVVKGTRLRGDQRKRSIALNVWMRLVNTHFGQILTCVEHYNENTKAKVVVKKFAWDAAVKSFLQRHANASAKSPQDCVAAWQPWAQMLLA